MDQHSADLFRAGEKIREWFVDHWQNVAKVLELASNIERDFDAVRELAKFVKGLKVVDPEPRLLELDKQLNKWRGMTMQVVVDAPKSRLQENIRDPEQLLEQMVLLNARITMAMASDLFPGEQDLVKLSNPSREEFRELVARLAELLREGAPWQG